MRFSAALPAALLLAVPVSGAGAQARDHGDPADAETRLPAVVVSVTRSSSEADDVPASTVSLEPARQRVGGLAVKLSDYLDAVPGVTARDRQNSAQDEQISIRGFGTRSSFGVRGLRVVVDGIPATMPDGQGQLSHIDLGSAERIEILRGPFSALYGNAAGGVIDISTGTGSGPLRTTLGAAVGADASRRLSLRASGGGAWGGYSASVSHFTTDGFREHSEAERRAGNLRLDFALEGGRELRLIANAVELPEAEDPLGLTREQYESDPRQATAVATLFDTRKSVGQQQLGLLLRQPLGDSQSLRMMVYGGRRDVRQFLSIPAGAQASPRSGGGVIDLDGTYVGADLRWQRWGELGGRPLETVVGLDLARQDQHRRGYENFVGEQLGVLGALRRNERNRVGNSDVYAQANWLFAERWSMLAGVRSSRVRFEIDDDYITGANPDDSGQVRYSEASPVLGLLFRPREDLRLFASAGQGFETPTFAELGYRSDGGSGPALDLAPALTDSTEVGLRWQPHDRFDFEAVLFRADTEDELAVASSLGGRTTFRNVAAARREGLELQLELGIAADWRLQLGHSRLDARFTRGYLACGGPGCSDPDVPVEAGAAIPGVPRSQSFARLRFDGGNGWRFDADARRVGRVSVNDRGSEFANAHVLLGLGLSREWRGADAALQVFARIDNLQDRRHVGSVIVNDGNGRYFEPGPGRQLLLGAELEWGR